MTVYQKIVMIMVLVFLHAFTLRAGKTAKPWSWETEAGYVQTTGNSRSASASAHTTFERSWKKYLLTLKGSHISSSQDESQSAESYSAHEKIDVKISTRLYVYEIAGWEKDRFAGIDARYNGQAGLGCKIIDTKRDRLDTEFGADYTIEEYLSGNDNDFTSARGYLKYMHELSATSKFTQEFEALKNLEDADDIRTKSITALSASINTKLVLKISYTVKYDREPAPGFKKTDTVLSTTLIFKW